MPIELPKAPFYRRWSVILAGVIGVAAIMAGLGWRGFQEVASPNPTSTIVAVPTTTLGDPPTTSAPSQQTTNRPEDVLWEELNSSVGLRRSQVFLARPGWRIEWSFDCSNFRKLGGGNFKITGNGAFTQVQIQKFDIKGSGSESFSRGGNGYLVIDSVCKRWTVRALAA
jgi:hypothetical protein